MTAVAFSFELPQPKRAVTVCKDGSIGLWNTDIRYIMKEDAKMIKQGFSELPGKKPYAFVALSPGPDYVIAAGSDSLVHFFDAATMRLIGGEILSYRRDATREIFRKHQQLIYTKALRIRNFFCVYS